MGAGPVPSAVLGHLLLLYLERSEVYRKGETEHMHRSNLNQSLNQRLKKKRKSTTTKNRGVIFAVAIPYLVRCMDP